MLTGEHAIVVYERGRARPDRLTRSAHRHYLAYAERMMAVYRTGIGRTRRDLHRSVEGILSAEPDCEWRRIRAFQKLLDDAAEYDVDRAGKAAALRLKVFGMAAPLHPLVKEPDRLFESGEAAVKALIAREIGRPWEEIDADLYADVIDFQRLRAFVGYPTAEALLSRYNVAQLQACLYRAERMVVTAGDDFKTILRYAKLAGLLHEIRRLGQSGYRFEFAGPASVLADTRRYGVNMARFLPALLACRNWSMEAVLRPPWGGKARLTLSDRDGFRSHLPPPEEFDSALEASFAARFGERRGGWRLLREAEVVHEAQAVFVPDFVFRHDDGTEVLFEIVGFWTPEYLERKRETCRRIRGRRMLLAVPARNLRPGAAPAEGVVVFRSLIRPEAVVETLERLRARP